MSVYTGYMVSGYGPLPLSLGEVRTKRLCIVHDDTSAFALRLKLVATLSTFGGVLDRFGCGRIISDLTPVVASPYVCQFLFATSPIEVAPTMPISISSS